MSEHASTDRLLALIREHALIEGGDFELASGARASVYIDLRRVTMHPEGADVIAELLPPGVAPRPTSARAVREVSS